MAGKLRRTAALLAVTTASTACFSETDPPMVGSAGGTATTDAGATEALPTTTMPAVDASTAGDASAGSGDSATSAATSGGCEPAMRSGPPLARPADLVLAIDPSLPDEALFSLGSALSDVAPMWMDEDVHLAFLADPMLLTAPWDDDCVTAESFPTPADNAKHPLAAIIDNAAGIACVQRPPYTSVRQYAVVSAVDPGKSGSAAFQTEILAPAMAATDARFHVGSTLTCGGAATGLEPLASSTCGNSLDVCTPAGALDFLQYVGHARGACRWPLDAPPGHTADEHGLEIEAPAQGVTLTITRVSGPDDCAALDAGNPPPREYYVDGEEVVLCPVTCCLVQGTPIGDLQVHESFACDG